MQQQQLNSINNSNVTALQKLLTVINDAIFYFFIFHFFISLKKHVFNFIFLLISVFNIEAYFLFI